MVSGDVIMAHGLSDIKLLSLVLTPTSCLPPPCCAINGFTATVNGEDYYFHWASAVISWTTHTPTIVVSRLISGDLYPIAEIPAPSLNVALQIYFGSDADD